MRALPRFVPTLLVASIAAACGVPKKDYDAALQSAATAQDGLRACNDEREQLRARAQGLEETLAQADKLLAERTRSVEEEQARAAALKKQLDDATLLEAELKSQPAEAGAGRGQAPRARRAQMASALEETRARLEDLRRQKAAAEALAATFRNLVERLKKMIDAGQLKVVVRDGRMLIALPNDVLFDSGRTDLKKEAQASLTEVAKVLATISRTGASWSPATPTTSPSTPSAFLPTGSCRRPGRWRSTRFLIAKGVKPHGDLRRGLRRVRPGRRERHGGGQSQEPAHRDRAPAEHRRAGGGAGWQVAARGAVAVSARATPRPS
jgi:flagellar motor protein MotB